MMLSGVKLFDEMLAKRIVIEPFDVANVNPNSYNLALADRLLVYRDTVLDLRADDAIAVWTIPPGGLLLQPNRVYLGSTIEYTETHAPWVPCIEGRSSIGRKGMTVHITAGFGDVGFCGRWTLELSVMQPLRVYAGIKVCQIAYVEVTMPCKPYIGKYQNQGGAMPSMLHKELR